MASSFFKQKRLSCKTYSLFGMLILISLKSAVLKCPKIRQDKILSNFENFRCQDSVNLKSGRFSTKVEKGGPYRVNQCQSGCRKAGPYQLQFNNNGLWHADYCN